MTPPLSDLIRVFGRIGLLSFGGPAAQISIMHQSLVERCRWLDEQSFLRALSLCMLLPGPEAMQLATYAGWRMRGVAGGLIAGGLFVLPGAVVTAGLVWLYVVFGDLPVVRAAFLGVKATVIVIVLRALLGLSRKALLTATHRAIAGLAFVAIFAFDVPFPLIIALAAICGFATGSVGVPETAVPALPAPSRTIRTAGLWMVCWLAPLVLLTEFGPPLLADLGWFFARLAVVTFGGAYAVLAYMTQTVVDSHGWITTDQMIDALGLAETTPGPLILVTQFVAMLTGEAEGGLALALAAGAVALWATFAPCFLWIFVAAPYLDHIARLPRLSNALSAITAAVVGVILNLSVWFGLNVLFRIVEEKNVGPVSVPVPNLASLDFPAVVLTGIAALLIFRMKSGFATTLAIMVPAGVALHFL